MPYKQPPKEHQFKKGEGGRPKGSRNFETIFNKAAKQVAEALRLGKEPGAVQIELVKRGVKEGLKGNYSFYRDIMDRLYGQPKGAVDVTTGSKPLSLLQNVLRNNSNK